MPYLAMTQPSNLDRLQASQIIRKVQHLDPVRRRTLLRAYAARHRMDAHNAVHEVAEHWRQIAALLDAAADAAYHSVHTA
jgi:hypothetical protein